MVNSSYSDPPKPGTYRIVSVAAQKNVIEVSPCNQERAICTPWINEPHQQWVLQSSGRGYKIKNVKYDVYLAVPSSTLNTVVGTSPKPTTWHLMRTHEGFCIQYGDENRVVDLHHGLDCYGNVLQLWGWSGNSSRRWSFERISDEVGNEVADSVEDQVTSLREQLQTQATTHHLEKVALEQQLAAKEQDLQAALQSQLEGQPQALRLMVELRHKMEELERLTRYQAPESGHKTQIMRADEA